MSNNVKKLNLNQIKSTKHVCQICGKGPSAANNRSHSMRATKTVVKPNTQKVTIEEPETQKTVRINICTRCLRTSNKKSSL